MQLRFCLVAVASLILIAGTSSAQQASFTSEGREFWLAFQKNFRDYVTDAQTSSLRPSEPLTLELSICSMYPTKGYVEIAGTGFRKEFTVTPLQVTRITIDPEAQIRSNGTVERLAVHVVADEPVTIYGLNRRYQTTDTYAAIPVNLLGTEYRAIGYGWLENDLLSQVAIVATEDNTVVTITPTATIARPTRAVTETQVINNWKEVPVIRNRDTQTTSSDTPVKVSIKKPKRVKDSLPARTSSIEPPQADMEYEKVLTLDTIQVTKLVPNGSAFPVQQPMTITLNRGETYQIIAAYNPGSTCDLTGSLIRSTKPVAIFSGHNCSYVPDRKTKACNLLVEQLPPVSTWGKTFVVGSIADRSWSVARVIAAEQGTKVRCNGARDTVLNAGEFMEYKHLAASTIIVSSKPTMVAQFAPGFDNGDNRGDPMMIVVPPVEQFTQELVFASPVSGSWHHYINVIAPTGAISAIQLDGNSLKMIDSTGFIPVGDGTYSVARINVSQGAHILKGATPFGAYQYGIGYDDAAYDAYGNGGGQLYRNLREEEE
jgi:hypothetical protein